MRWDHKLIICLVLLLLALPALAQAPKFGLTFEEGPRMDPGDTVSFNVSADIGGIVILSIPLDATVTFPGGNKNPIELEDSFEGYHEGTFPTVTPGLYIVEVTTDILGSPMAFNHTFRIGIQEEPPFLNISFLLNNSWETRYFGRFPNGTSLLMNVTPGMDGNLTLRSLRQNRTLNISGTNGTFRFILENVSEILTVFGIPMDSSFAVMLMAPEAPAVVKAQGLRNLSSPKSILAVPKQPIEISWDFLLDTDRSDIITLGVITEGEVLSIKVKKGAETFQADDSNLDGMTDTGIILPGERFTVIATVTAQNSIQVTLNASPFRSSSIVVVSNLLTLDGEIQEGPDGDLLVLGIEPSDEATITIMNDGMEDAIADLDVQYGDMLLSFEDISLCGGCAVPVKTNISMIDGLITAMLHRDGKNLLDADPGNDYRSLLSDDSWSVSGSPYRIPIRFMTNDYERNFTIKVKVNLDDDAKLDSLQVFAPSFSSSHLDYSFQPAGLSHSSFDSTSMSGYLVIVIGEVIPNMEGTAYLYYSVLPGTQTLVDLPGMIVDNRDPEVSTIGVWLEDYRTPGYHGADFVHDRAGEKGKTSFIFRPGVQTSSYEAYLHYPAMDAHSASTPVTILHKSGSDTVRVNQQVSVDWFFLGSYDLNQSSEVVIGTDGTEGTVVADALRLVKISTYAEPGELEFLLEGGSSDALMDSLAEEDIPSISLKAPVDGIVTADLSSFGPDLSFSHDLGVNISYNGTHAVINSSVNGNHTIDIASCLGCSREAFIELESYEDQRMDDGTIGECNTSLTIDLSVFGRALDNATIDTPSGLLVSLNGTRLKISVDDNSSDGYQVLLQSPGHNGSLNLSIVIGESGCIGLRNHAWVDSNFTPPIPINISQNGSYILSANLSINLSGNDSSSSSNLSLNGSGNVSVNLTLPVNLSGYPSNITLPMNGSVAENGSANISTNLSEALVESPSLLIDAPYQYPAVAGQPVRWKIPVQEDGQAELPFGAEEVRILDVNGSMMGDVSSISLNDGTPFKRRGGILSMIRKSETRRPDEIVKVKTSPKARAIEFITTAPEVKERQVTKDRKQVILESGFHYQNITTSAGITPARPDQVRLYWMVDGERRDVTDDPSFNLTMEDSDNDGLVELLTWIAPHTSVQVFEIEIIILDEITILGSEVIDGKLWVVRVKTLGKNDLVLKGTRAVFPSEIHCGNLTTFAVTEHDVEGIIQPPDIPEEIVDGNDPSPVFEGRFNLATDSARPGWECDEETIIAFTIRSEESIEPPEYFISFGEDRRYLDPSDTGNLSLEVETLGGAVETEVIIRMLEGETEITPDSVVVELHAIDGSVTEKAVTGLTTEFRLIVSSDENLYSKAVVRAEKGAAVMSRTILLENKGITEHFGFDENIVLPIGGVISAIVLDENRTQAPFAVDISDDMVRIRHVSNAIRPGRYQAEIVQDNSTLTVWFTYGLVSINTRKPLYHPGEEAEVLMVVLDKEGRIVHDASVILEAESPAGQSIVRSTGSGIIVDSLGIYQANITLEELGTYSLMAKAITGDGDVIISSSVRTAERFIFDIVRDVPMTFDPWRGPFKNTFRVEALGWDKEFDIIERLPSSFEILDSGGAEVRSDGSTTTLTWKGVSSKQQVSYVSQVPFLTPYLYELGKAEIRYGGLVGIGEKSFLEDRAWLLAVDPAIQGDALFMWGQGFDGTGGYTEQLSPRYKFFDITTSSLGEAKSDVPDGADHPRWVEVASHPFKEEALTIWQTEQQDVFAAVWNGSAWKDNLTLELTTGSNYKAIAAAFTQNTGSGIVVWGDNTNTPKYRVWNGSSWGAESSASNVGGTVRFIEMEPSYNISSEKIIMGTLDVNGHINVQVWGGSSWSGVTEVSTDSFATLKTFDVAWEGDSDHGMIVYRNGNNNNIHYRAYVNSAWDAADQTAAGMGDDAYVIQIASDHKSDRIIALLSDADADLNAFIWSGSAWTNMGEPTSELQSTSYIGFDAAFEGVSEDALIHYIEWENNPGSNSDYMSVRYRVVSNGTTAYGAENTVGAYTYNLAHIVSADSAYSDNIYLIAMTNWYDIGFATWGGSSWSNTGLATSGHPSDDAEAAYRMVSVVEMHSISAPNATIKGLNVTSGSIALRTHKIIAYSYWEDAVRGLRVPAFASHDGNGSNRNRTAQVTGRWANYSMVLSNLTEFPFAGRVDVQGIYASDVGMYGSTGNLGYFFIYDYSNLTKIHSSKSTLNQSETFTVRCQAFDKDISSPIQDYTVYLYRGTTYIGSDKTNSSGWAEFNTSFAVPGTYTYNCSIGSSGYYYTTLGQDHIDVQVTIFDSTPPSITLLGAPDCFETVAWPVWTNFSASDIYSSLENCSIWYYNDTGFVSRQDFPAPPEAAEQGHNLTLPGFQNITWNVECFDDAFLNNRFRSENRSFSVIDDRIGPGVNLISPPDSVDTPKNVSFIFNATDKLHGVKNCTLYVDGIANSTIGPVTEGQHHNITMRDLDFGTHTWRVKCFDDSPRENLGQSAVFEFTVGTDNTGPDVDLIWPINGSTDTDGKVNFTYVASDFMGSVANCSLILAGIRNDTDLTIIEGINQSFSFGMVPEGSYSWHVSCYDDSVNRNMGNSSGFLLEVDYDLASPNVTLISPGDGYESVIGDLNFQYNVTDESSILNCSLIVNSTVNQTDFIVAKGINQSFSLAGLGYGSFNWTVRCFDASDSRNWSEAQARNVTIGPDTLPPKITLIGPENTSTDTDGEVQFAFMVEDVTSGIDQCELFVNGTSVAVDNSINEGIVQYIYSVFPDSVYEWNVECTDDSPQLNDGQSDTWYFKVEVTFETKYTLTLFDSHVAQGEEIYPEALLKDIAGSLLVGGEAYAGIIRNLGRDNQTLYWWNESWKRRIEIPVTSHADESFTYPVINITLDTASLISQGLLNANCSDLRFAGQSNEELPYYFYNTTNGCNRPNTKILVKASNIWNRTTHRIGIYFNNSDAVVNRSSHDDYLFADNFEEDSFAVGYWQTGSTTLAGGAWRTTGTAYDGTGMALIRLDCSGDSQCEYASETSSFEKAIYVNGESTLRWRWRRHQNRGTVNFYLDGILDDSTTSATYVESSVVLSPGTHLVKWQFTYQGNDDSNQDASVDHIFLRAKNITQGTVTTQSEHIEYLVPQVTDALAKANFSWDSSGIPYGNYSVTGYGSLGAYWPDNGFYYFLIGRDSDRPQYLSWALSVFQGAPVLRGENVTASSLWKDNVNLSYATIEHNASGTAVNYSIAPFGLRKVSWANYTLDTSDLAEFPSIGRIYVRSVHVNDTSGNSNRTVFVRYFSLYSTSEINHSNMSKKSVLQFRNFSYSCFIRDEFDNGSISGYPVRFYLAGAFKGIVNTDADGNATFTFNATSTGNLLVKCNISDSGYYYSGSPAEKVSYINVSDISPPIVQLISPSNNSIRTSKLISFAARPTDPTLASCMLYGNWGSGWHLQETRNDFTSGAINYFTQVSLYNGLHQWYVRCNDSSGNLGTSATWRFNISVPGPIITLQSPAHNTMYTSPTIVNFTYYVSDIKNISNCSLIVNGAVNSTDFNVTVNASNTFEGLSLDYGRYDWSVTCYNNESVEGMSPTWRAIVMGWEMIGPSMGTKIDRDGLNSSIADSALLHAKDIGGAEDINISFILNLSDPSISLAHISLGQAISNASGSSVFTFNPNSSIAAGRYLVWGNATTYDKATLNGTYVQIYGALDLVFNGTRDPDPSYNHSDIILVVADAHTMGLETRALLNASYMRYFNVTMASPSGVQNFTKELIFDGNNWTASFLTDGFTELGAWNISLRAMFDHHYINMSSWKEVMIVDQVPPVINLTYPANGSTLLRGSFNFNFTAEESFPDTCLLYGNWSGSWQVNASISFANGSNSFPAVTLPDGHYVWNVLCNDTTGNTAFAQKNRTFTVDTTPPEVTLISPENRSLTSSGVVNLSFNVTDIDGISSCSLILGGAKNLTNWTVAKGVPQNFTLSLGYGLHEWYVSCNTTHGQERNSSRWELRIPELKVSWPSHADILDRDNATGTWAYQFMANLSLPLEGLNITYYINRTFPGSGSPIKIGRNVTDVFGITRLKYDLPASLAAGNYSWFAELVNTSVNSTNAKGFKLYGWLNVTFGNATHRPALSYGLPNQTSYAAILRSRGAETDEEINLTYLARLNTTLKPPTIAPVILANIYNGSSWNSSYYLSQNAKIGIWNVTFNASAEYFYSSSVQRTMNITAQISLDVWHDYGGGGVSRVYESIVFSANFTDSSGTTIASGNCTITFNDSVQENMTFDISGNSLFEFNRSFLKPGNFTWYVNCSDYMNVSAESSVMVNRTVENLLMPDGVILDRDGKNALSVDAIELSGLIPSAPSGLNVSFFMQRTDPGSSALILIGINRTNASGHTSYWFNPSSATFAGNYTLSANGTYADRNVTRYTHLIGSLNLTFADPSSDPDASYEHGSIVDIRVNVTSFGSESQLDLNTSYNLSTLLKANFSSKAYYLDSPMQFNGSSTWNWTFFIPTTIHKGSYNVSAEVSPPYFFPIRTDNRSVAVVRYRANISAWDQYDPEEGYITAWVGENITFYANYTRQTTGTWISPANCTFGFHNSVSKDANPLAARSLYVQNRTYYAPGLLDWNVTCNASLYENLTLSLKVRVFPRTNITVEKKLNLTGALRYNVSLMIDSHANHPELLGVYDFLPWGALAWDYSYGPNATLELPVGLFRGNVTKTNTSLPARSQRVFTYKVTFDDASDQRDYLTIGG